MAEHGEKKRKKKGKSSKSKSKRSISGKRVGHESFPPKKAKKSKRHKGSQSPEDGHTQKRSS